MLVPYFFLECCSNTLNARLMKIINRKVDVLKFSDKLKFMRLASISRYWKNYEVNS